MLFRSILAYHDRSDGGLFATLAEMSFAGHVGISVCLNDDLCGLNGNINAALFNEELGAVVQVKSSQVEAVSDRFLLAGASVSTIGHLSANDLFEIRYRDRLIFSKRRDVLQSAWSETSFKIASLRDNADCVRQEFARIQQLAEKPPVNAEAVNRIKSAIANGEYPINLDLISDALMDAYRDLKT